MILGIALYQKLLGHSKAIYSITSDARVSLYHDRLFAGFYQRNGPLTFPPKTEP